MKKNLTIINYAFLLIIIVISLVLRTYNLQNFMSFFPDMGVYYLAARDMLVDDVIPLVGTATSHPWVHHGAFWSYILAGIFWITNFNPIAPAYFIAILGSFTVILFYFIVKDIFGKNEAILSTILFATSPLIVLHSRIPYHTSSVPFLVLSIFYITYKWVSGKIWMFPVLIFLLAVTYNFSIQSFVFTIIIGLIFLYGLITKKDWVIKLKNAKLIFTSAILFLIPMIPFIVYDVGNKSINQTLKIFPWIAYRIAKFPLSLIDPSYKSAGSDPLSVYDFFVIYSWLIFPISLLIAFGILILTIIFILSYFKNNFRIQKNKFRFKKKLPYSYGLLFAFTLIVFVGLAVHRVPIDADFLLIAPLVLILTTLSTLWIFKNKLIPSFIFILFFAIVNIYYLFSTNFFTLIDGQERLLYKDKLSASEEVLKIADDRNYNLIGKGPLDDFDSFLMPYEFMLWRLGNAPSDREEDLKIVIWEKNYNIIVEELK